MEREQEFIKQEPMRPPSSEFVDVGDGSVAHEIKKDGGSFNLNNLFESHMLGSDKFVRVFFRTEDDNIYCLDNKGNLVDTFESQKQGKIVEYRLDKENLKNVNLFIDGGFKYGDNNEKTKKIKEIIPTTINKYAQNQEHITDITEGRKNNILDEFDSRIEKFKYNMDPANPNYNRSWIGPEGAVSYVMTPEEKKYLLENKEGPFLRYLNHKALKLKAYLLNNPDEEDFDRLQAMNFQEEKKENPPLGIMFSPKEELNNLRALPKEERKEALRIFKDKLIRQRKALASCRLFLEKNIEFDNDVLLTNKLHDLINKFGEEYGFDHEQRDILHGIVLEYGNRRRNTLKTRNLFTDDYKLVEHLTGVKLNPNEKLEISIGPASIDIKTNSAIARKLYNQSEDGGFVDTSFLGGFASSFFAEQHSGYPSPVNYTVVIEEYETKKGKIMTHEHEHVKNSVHQKYLDLEPSVSVDISHFLLDYKNNKNNPELQKVVLEDFCNQRRLGALKFAKDEIMSILSESTIQELQKNLNYLFFENEMPFYDWFPDIRDILNKDLHNDSLAETTIQGLIFNKYRTTVENAVHAYEELIRSGEYSNQKANALLVDKPLYRWPGTIKRILKYDKKIKGMKYH